MADHVELRTLEDVGVNEHDAPEPVAQSIWSRLLADPQNGR
jgi:hypothetical protein